MNDSELSPRLWTVGHGSRTLPQLLALLQAHAIRGVLDVRRVPHSRWHPHFGAERLAAALAAAAIRYDHRGGLGGMRKLDGTSTNAGLGVTAFRSYADYMQTAEFAAELEGVLALARAGRTAMMCAEASPGDCHRSLIADALVARRIEVEHILDVGATRRHTIRATARIDGGRVSYPPAQTELGLTPADS